MPEIRKLQVTCPCCDAQLTVEASTGEVLFVKQAEKKGLSFEDAVAQVKRQQETASERFDQAFAKERSRKELIDLKFKEAMERADELKMPLRDIDLE